MSAAVPDDHDPASGGAVRVPRWLPWAAGAAAAAVIAGTFWATAPSRTPAQARVETVTVVGFVAAPGADAATRRYAQELAAPVRAALGRTPGLTVVPPGATAAAAKFVDGVVERREEEWRVAVRIVDARGVTVAARTRRQPLAQSDALGVEVAREVTRALRLPPPKVEHVVR